MPLSVLTLNLWHDQGPWPERAARVREWIERLNPDLIGFQEVLRGGSGRDMVAELLGRSGYHVAHAPATPFWREDSVYHPGEFGNAVASRFPILESRSWELPGRESGETRCLLHALVETPAGRLPFFVTHLNWKLHHGSVRVRQAVAIAERVMDLAPTASDDLPPVLVGDFNADPDSDEIRFLTGRATIDGRSVYFADAWQFAGDGGPGPTFDGKKNPFAALAHEPPRRIDYVFVRGPDRKLRGEPVRAEVAFVTPASVDGQAVFPSDHYGVFADLVVAPRSA